ncbi:MAG: DEAD/DEAH box helicase [Candidatus Firestonebacteria bacterium]|nr:DEAD/DEAH box helicase [Candidatus Firestonebacteria bacterium]
MNFEKFKLDPRIVQGLEEAGYTKPTPIQSAALPVILGGSDLIGTAQTGTGKTAAFVLPLLQHLLHKEKRGHTTRVLVLTPTRELAEQIHEVITMLGKHTHLRSATVYGGVGIPAQAKALQQGVEMIVACPGRLLDHVERGNAKLGQVEVLVLDEADRMLDMGFWPSIRQIMKLLPKHRQTLLFSATFTPALERLFGDYLHEPQRISVNVEAPANTVAHALYPVSQNLKPTLLLRVLGEMTTRSVLIFTRTKVRADQVAHILKKAAHKADALHANKTQKERQETLDQFRSGELPILVATDIAARGLDIESISHVINYDMPDSATSYIHRIGRTGRASRSGDAITLTTWADQDVVRDIEKILGTPIERKVLPDFPYDEPLPKDTSIPEVPKTMSSRHTSTVRRRL